MHKLLFFIKNNNNNKTFLYHEEIKYLYRNKIHSFFFLFYLNCLTLDFLISLFIVALDAKFMIDETVFNITRFIIRYSSLDIHH